MMALGVVLLLMPPISMGKPAAIDYKPVQTINFQKDIGLLNAQGRMLIGDLNGDSLMDFVLTNGKTFVVGHPPNARKKVTQFIDRKIGVIQLHPNPWKQIEQERWGMGFLEGFFSGILEHHIIPIPLVDSTEPSKCKPFDQKNLDSLIRKSIRQYGDSFQAIVVFGMGVEYIRQGTKDFGALIAKLCQHNRLVIWFDYLDEGGVCRKSPKVRKMLSEAVKLPQVKKWFRRFAVDELKAVDTALEILIEEGHQVIGLPDPYPEKKTNWDWTTQRTSLIQERFKRISDTFQLLPPSLAQPVASYSAEEILETTLVRWPVLTPVLKNAYDQWKKSTNLPGTPSYEDFEEIIKLTPLLAPYLFDKGATAIIALNDAAAFQYYRWFQLSQISVPTQISLISFDNRMQDFYPFMISSLDFGFHDLARKLIQLITGESPVRVNKNCTVSSLIHLNHRLTIGN